MRSVIIVAILSILLLSNGLCWRFTITASSLSSHGRWTHTLNELKRYYTDEGLFHIEVGDNNPIADSHEDFKSTFGSDAVFVSVVGNHEATEQAQMDYLHTLYDSYPNVVNAGPSGTSKTTYSMDWNNAHIVVLNLYYDGSSEGSGSGGVVDELYEWLKDDLSETEQPIKLVFGHEPAFPEYRHQSDSLNEDEENRDRFWKLLNDEKVLAYFSGHTHYYYNSRVGSSAWEDYTWGIEVGNAGTESFQNFLNVEVDENGGSIDVSVYEGTQSNDFCLVEDFTIAVDRVKRATPEPSKDTWRFTVTADPRSKGTNWRHVLEEIKRIRSGIGEFHVCAGDVDPVEERHNDFKQIFGDDEVFIPTMGNHEIESQDDIDYLNSLFSTYPNVQKNGPVNSEHSTFSMDINNAHIIVINPYYDGESDHGSSGDVVDELYDWLVDDLGETTQPIRFIFAHEPAFPEYRHQSDSLNQEHANRDRFWKLLTENDVLAFFVGHTHMYYDKLVSSTRWDPITWQIDAGDGGNSPPSNFINVDVDNKGESAFITVYQGTSSTDFEVINEFQIVPGSYDPNPSQTPTPTPTRTCTPNPFQDIVSGDVLINASSSFILIALSFIFFTLI
ncbi:purple acid phosphatase [Anaeramoeba flamelloides]|uniref:Purple acid phosphatase n=1 Tax=Anaeramoeba flamelloides TaxID=1746091 RepID=A0ABQ8Y272_9EUKA|nr:purple acid phosphatase [Anaeramoeba flamelloides]